MAAAFALGRLNRAMNSALAALLSAAAVALLFCSVNGSNESTEPDQEKLPVDAKVAGWDEAACGCCCCCGRCCDGGPKGCCAAGRFQIGAAVAAAEGAAAAPSVVRF